jgi:hypothetical protein
MVALGSVVVSKSGAFAPLEAGPAGGPLSAKEAKAAARARAEQRRLQALKEEADALAATIVAAEGGKAPTPTIPQVNTAAPTATTNAAQQQPPPQQQQQPQPHSPQEQRRPPPQLQVPRDVTEGGTFPQRPTTASPLRPRAKSASAVTATPSVGVGNGEGVGAFDGATGLAALAALEKYTFESWINVRLNGRGVFVSDLFSDLRRCRVRAVCLFLLVFSVSEQSHMLFFVLFFSTFTVEFCDECVCVPAAPS